MLSRQIWRRLLSRQVVGNAKLFARSRIHPASQLGSQGVTRISHIASFSHATSSPEGVDTERQAQVEQDEEDYEAEDAIFRDDIANLALTKYVPLYGWTEEALYKSIEELKYSNAMIGLFPNGASDLVQFFVMKSNTELIEELEQFVEEENPRTTELIRHAIKLRLRKNIPYIPHLAQAMALSVRPQSIQDSFQHLAWLVDDVWHMANDTSTDLNWYSKRFMLAGVYTATELYMITDRSHDYANTWAFLDRRLADLKAVMAAPHQSQEVLNTMCSAASGVLGSLGALFTQTATQPQASNAASVLRDVANNIASNMSQHMPNSPSAQGVSQAVAGLGDALNGMRTKFADAPGNPLSTVASAVGSAAQSLAQTPVGAMAQGVGAAAQALATNGGVRPEHVAEMVSGTVASVMGAVQSARAGGPVHVRAEGVVATPAEEVVVEVSVDTTTAAADASANVTPTESTSSP